MHAVLLICSFLGGLTVGCTKKVATVATPPAPAPLETAPLPSPPVPAASLAVEPSTIERGQAATLRWWSSDATDLSISGIGKVEANGTREVRPQESTVYRLSAKGPGGETTASATLNVTLPPPPPVLAPAPPPVRTLTQRIEEDLRDAYFNYDNSDLREDAQSTLSTDAAALRLIIADFPNVVIAIEGYCDERGSAEYNLGLGDRRASSTLAYLIVLGVPAGNLETVSYGKERSQCTEATEECWQRNRRVHFSAMKSGPGQSGAIVSGQID
jgi:peptidoglycan-associated lipoprotein